MSAYSIVVLTTEGPSQLIRLACEGEGIQSVVCLNRSTEKASISSAYESFVSRPTGLIEARFGPGGYRVDLSENITAGNSWQLGFYLAHMLSEQGILGGSVTAQGEVLWVTGALNHDQQIIPVSHVDLKLVRSEPLLRRLQKEGIKFRFLLPEANLREVDRAWMERNDVGLSHFVPLSDLSQLEALFGQQVAVADPEPSQSVAWRLGLLFVATIFVLLLSTYFQSGEFADSIVRVESKVNEEVMSFSTAEVLSSQIDQLQFSWRPIYRINEVCSTHSDRPVEWNHGDGQQVPVVDAKQLCGIEVMPFVEEENFMPEQLEWNLVLRVESDNQAHPLIRLDGYSYFSKGKKARWFVPLPDTLLSGVQLRWEVQMSHPGGDQLQQNFRQRIGYPYQW